MSDVLLIDIPKFQVNFENGKNYGTIGKKKRENLSEALYNASRRFCMYCYTRIQIDNCRTGHFEHGIEKNISLKKLKNCVPDIGISCSICNDKYKKYNEKERRPKKEIIEQFEKEQCVKNCTQECPAFLKLKQEYVQNEKAHIILQPSGIKGEDTGQELLLQYDVLETKFIPNQKYAYSEKEKKFIWDHINRFHLNAEEDKTKQLIRFVEDIIDKDGQYAKVDYNNLIVELFVEQVLKGRTKDEILKICKLIYSYSLSKFRT